MFGKKTYGESRVSSCPFCGASAYSKNSQGIPVCAAHKSREVGELKCACGAWLDLREGKWGPFGLCITCGPVNWSKVLSMNPDALKEKKAAATNAKVPNKHPMIRNEGVKKATEFLDSYGKEKWVRSDDPRFEFR